MKASVAGQVECMKVLLDRGAEVNMLDKVIGVIIHWYMQCSMYPEFPPLVEDVHACIN